MGIFKRPEISDCHWMRQITWQSRIRSADFSFANIYCWDHDIDPYVARYSGRMLVRMNIGGRWVYLYPAGEGDILPALEAMAEDAKTCGSRFVIAGIPRETVPELMTVFDPPPELTFNENDSDYVYLAEDLATLSGKKYHTKKNHVNRFSADYDWRFEPITRDNIKYVREMAAEWFVDMEEERGQDYASEAEAIHSALDIYFDVDLEGGMIIADGRPAAFTIGEFLCDDTLNTHFEKASPHVNGAYTVINREFAKHMVAKYPSIKYINREEDMGIENLRRSKQSYHPVFMVDKFVAEWHI